MVFQSQVIARQNVNEAIAGVAAAAGMSVRVVVAVSVPNDARVWSWIEYQ